MEFVPITNENFDAAIRLRPREDQYVYMIPYAVLYSLGRAYITKPPYEVIPYILVEERQMVGAIRLRYYGHGVGFAAFFIDRNFQRKGYARLALRELPGLVKRQFPSAREIELCVHRENTVARYVFETMGYVYTGVENDDGTLDMEYVM